MYFVLAVDISRENRVTGNKGEHIFGKFWPIMVNFDQNHHNKGFCTGSQETGIFVDVFLSYDLTMQLKTVTHMFMQFTVYCYILGVSVMLWVNYD